MKASLEAQGAKADIIAPRLGTVISENEVEVPVNHSLLTAASVL